MKQRGFTLIELVVVMSLFMLILGATVNIFISVVKHQKRILFEQELLGQLGYAKDYVAEALRGAKKDVSGNCLADAGVRHPGFWFLLTRYNEEAKSYEGIKFIDGSGTCQEIFFSQFSGGLAISENGAKAQDIISNKFHFGYVRFIVNGDRDLFGATFQDAVQPRITMAIDAKIPTEDSFQEKLFQMTVSLEDLNL